MTNSKGAIERIRQSLKLVSSDDKLEDARELMNRVEEACLNKELKASDVLFAVQHLNTLKRLYTRNNDQIDHALHREKRGMDHVCKTKHCCR